MHLAVISAFPPKLTGLGQYGWHVTHGLAARAGFATITVLAEAFDGAADEAGPVRVRRVWRRDDAGSLPALWRALWEARPDVLWFNTGMAMFGRSRRVNFMALMTPLLARRARIPVVTTLHEVFETVHARDLGMQNGAITTLGAQLATRMLLASNVVCVTLGQYARLLRARYNAHNVRHLPLGTYTAATLLPRPAHAPPRDVLFFSHHAPHRGLETLLAAFNTVRARCPGATLTIAGSDHARFPGYLGSVRATANRQSGLRWRGPQAEAALPALFADSTLVALPYLATTGSSSVMFRAAAHGRPLLVSDLPDLRVAAAEANLRVNFAPPGDAEAWGERLAALLADGALRRAQAEHNVHAVGGLTLAATCARYEALLKDAATAAQS
jgi:glycosyltransferase involved in cell wall biosynthesis